MSLFHPPHLARLFHQRKFPELYAAIEAEKPGSSSYEAAQLWRIRGLMDQGYMRRAKQQIDVYRPKNRLYQLLLQLYQGYWRCLQSNLDLGLAALTQTIADYRSREPNDLEKVLW